MLAARLGRARQEEGGEQWKMLEKSVGESDQRDRFVGFLRERRLAEESAENVRLRFGPPFIDREQTRRLEHAGRRHRGNEKHVARPAVLPLRSPHNVVIHFVAIPLLRWLGRRREGVDQAACEQILQRDAQFWRNAVSRKFKHRRTLRALLQWQLVLAVRTCDPRKFKK